MAGPPLDPHSDDRVIEDPRVTVVVATKDRRDELLARLPRHRSKVVVVDNGSADGTSAAVRTACPDVVVVPLRQNVGAFARTLGARRAGTELVAFADDDSWSGPAARGKDGRRSTVGSVVSTMRCLDDGSRLGP